MRNSIIIILFLGLFVLLSACSKSDKEVNRLREESYNNGYYDALDCVKRKGGSANSAADACENE
jgi:major membrane immunogen (membrane-anchored lipoprotein)